MEHSTSRADQVEATQSCSHVTEGTPVRLRVILDHDPGREVHLPLAAHLDAIYLQQGDHFITVPAEIPALPRFLSLMPQRPDYGQVSLFEQHMDGAFSGGFCARF